MYLYYMNDVSSRTALLADRLACNKTYLNIFSFGRVLSHRRSRSVLVIVIIFVPLSRDPRDLHVAAV